MTIRAEAESDPPVEPREMQQGVDHTGTSILPSIEMDDLAAIDTPLLDAVLGLVRQRARLAGCYP